MPQTSNAEPTGASRSSAYAGDPSKHIAVNDAPLSPNSTVRNSLPFFAIFTCDERNSATVRNVRLPSSSRTFLSDEMFSYIAYAFIFITNRDHSPIAIDSTDSNLSPQRDTK